MSTRSLALVAALVIAGCSQRPPAPAQTPPLASQPTTGQEVGAVAQNQIEITFENSSARLTPDAGSKLDVAARLFRDVGPARMFAIGHSDSRGDEFANVLLSAKRAQAVKQGLIDRGIPPDRLHIQAFGESDPISRTAPDAGENRRVVVKWEVL